MNQIENGSVFDSYNFLDNVQRGQPSLNYIFIYSTLLNIGGATDTLGPFRSLAYLASASRFKVQ